MVTILDPILTIGVRDNLSKSDQRSVILCNSLSLFLASIPFLFTTLVWIMYGSGRFSWPLLIQPLVMLTPIIINAFGFTRISRMLLSWLTPLIVTVYSVYNKSHGIDIETASYVGFRTTMIAASIVPFLVFELNQKSWMIVSVLVPVAIILGYDTIHSWFGVGYYQMGLTDISYPINNIRAFIAILIIGSVTVILKLLIAKGESDNERLVKELSEAHQEVQAQLKEIVAKNQEINQQNQHIQSQNQLLEIRYQDILKSQQRLIENQQDLKKANETIEHQKQLLTNENKQLELEMLQRNKDLEKSIQDLMQSNNNMTQYSFMVSHNLRGPVASLLGLMSIVPRERLDKELELIYQKAYDSVNLLDSVIRDINSILDTQRSLLNIKQKVYWQDLVNKNLKFFKDDIINFGIKIKTDFERAPFILSIRTVLDSIVYNLISNAIKFRSPQRALQIQFETFLDNQQITVKVTDNGLGIDLVTQKTNLFKMYKRLHSHVEGKGLGLYLVKMQTELLNGSIDVESEINQYTTFILQFPVANAAEQVLFEKDYGRITYNALNNTTEIHFLRNCISEEFREIYLVGLEFLKRFNVTFTLVDLRKSNLPSPEDQQWLLNHIAPDASKSGLKKVAILTASLEASSEMDGPNLEIGNYLVALGIEQRYFSNQHAAREWFNL